MLLFEKEAYEIQGACFEVYKQLGTGFLEAVYQECLDMEMRQRKIPFVAQPKLEIAYKGKTIHQCYVPDFVCYQNIIVEIKSVDALHDVHRAQLLNYLKITHFRLGLLINFGSFPKLEVLRIAN